MEKCLGAYIPRERLPLSAVVVDEVKMLRETALETLLYMLAFSNVFGVFMIASYR